MDENLDRIGRAMMAAWGRLKKAQGRTWSEWMIIGDGLLEGRHWAMKVAGTNKPEGKGYVTAYAEWLKRYKVDDMDRSDRAKLLQLMEERPAVEEWRATLSDHERRNLNNPVIIWRKWTAATRVKKPRSRTAGVSATEHGRAQATVEQLQARVEELEQELTSVKADAPAPSDGSPASPDDVLALLRLLVPNAVAESLDYGGEQWVELVARPDLGFNRLDLETLGDLIALMVENMPADEPDDEPAEAKPAPKHKRKAKPAKAAKAKGEPAPKLAWEVDASAADGWDGEPAHIAAAGNGWSY
jgi:hypothetical protein